MKIDLHVHVVGNGSGNSGCWYRPRLITRLGAPFMLHGFGLPAHALRHDLETAYIARLLQWVRGSTLDAAVVLAQEAPYTATGRRLDGAGSFFVPNSYVLALARAHPELLAGVSIHPARADALEELEACLAGGAVLLKCLPNCQNIDWNDPRYTRFLERMAEAGLPLLAHTGGEHTLPVVDARLADPRVLRRPLEIGVTCIAAHCGLASGLWDPDYFDVFLGMLTQYPNLYGDNSAFPLPTRRLSAARLRRCCADELAGRILHGSDAPVPAFMAPMQWRGLISADVGRQIRRCRNPLERDVLLKTALGFPPESFTRAAHLLRLPARCGPRP